MTQVFNLPTKEQFDTQNALLATIASHMEGGLTVNNWTDVQRIVRMGLADKVFNVGDQFVSNYGTGDSQSQITWDIIGIDHDIPTDKKYTHSLTLQAHNCIMNCQFDAPELLYYAESELAVGTYHFADSYSGKNFALTTTIALPIGGSIEVSAWSSEIPTQIKTYNASNELLETLTVSEGNGGTLITCNDLRRVRYGSNNYVESNIKQWLNSGDSTFVWAKKSIYSKPSIESPYTGGGFLSQLDADLVGIIGSVDKQVARNTVTDDSGQDTFSDKVFLLSRKEVYGCDEGVVTGENPYAYYSSLASSPTTSELAGRIKYLGSSARIWWLRSPYTGHSYIPRYVSATGGVNYGSNASYASGLAPACCIV